VTFAVKNLSSGFANAPDLKEAAEKVVAALRN
jgi:hypothetical protein